MIALEQVEAAETEVVNIFLLCEQEASRECVDIARLEDASFLVFAISIRCRAQAPN